MVETRILDDEKSVGMMKDFITTVGVFQKMHGCNDDQVVGLLTATLAHIHFSHGFDDKLLKETFSDLVDGHYKDHLDNIKKRSN